MSKCKQATMIIWTEWANDAYQKSKLCISICEHDFKHKFNSAKKLKVARYDEYFSEFVQNIGTKGNYEKVDFIRKVLLFSDQEQCASFEPESKPKFNKKQTDKLFFNKDDKPREWIFVEKNIFYCVYCKCFAEGRSEDEISTIGINFNASHSRLSQKLLRHEESGTHALAQKVYQNMLTNRNHPIRESVKCIIKSILFLATHGIISCNFLYQFLKEICYIFTYL